MLEFTTGHEVPKHGQHTHTCTNARTAGDLQVESEAITKVADALHQHRDAVIVGLLQNIQLCVR